MSKLPYMPLYCDALLGDTLSMRREVFGSYMLLLTAMWCNNGELKNDDAELAQIARVSVKEWQKLKSLLWGKFTAYTDSQGRELITQNRLKREWDKSMRRSVAYALNGQRGGQMRGHRLATGKQPLINGQAVDEATGLASKKENISSTPEELLAALENIEKHPPHIPRRGKLPT